jgi:hypothetical protein
MNILTAHSFARSARRWGALLAAIFLVVGARADAPGPGRFLLIFETSPGLEKNLPLVKQTLDGLFVSNLQHEMQDNDDLAVWTVDQDLHTGTFPLASWSPEDAEMYSSRLKDFLGRQSFTRHASLAAVQPLLNRVVKNSERLTVLIFCDGQSNLLGTPYDSGMNEIIKKAAAGGKGAPGLFILVLRSYRGEYLGGSVNRSGPVNFPKFPPPAKPEPSAVIKPTTVVAPTVVPVPALIIVGTNVGTNLSAASKPVPQAAPQPATNAPATNRPATAPKIVAALTPSPVPVSNPSAPVKSAPVPAPVIQKNPAPEPVAKMPLATATEMVAATNPPMVTDSNAVAAPAADMSADSGFKNLILISGGMLVVAVGLVVWLVTRSRGPRGSLITSSMQDDRRLPPRK